MLFDHGEFFFFVFFLVSIWSQGTRGVIPEKKWYPYSGFWVSSGWDMTIVTFEKVLLLFMSNLIFCQKSCKNEKKNRKFHFCSFTFKLLLWNWNAIIFAHLHTHQLYWLTVRVCYRYATYIMKIQNSNPTYK